MNTNNCTSNIKSNKSALIANDSACKNNNESKTKITYGYWESMALSK